MLQFGLSTFADLGDLSPRQRFQNLLEEGRKADELGFDVFAVGEHHRADYAVSSPPVALAALAAITQNIRLSSAVMVLSSDDPVRVFEQFATLDNISNGRAEIMAGRGSFIESFPLFGYNLQDYETLFAEKLDLLASLCRQEAVSVSGKHVQPLQDVTVYPRPVQQPLPLWVAVGGTPQSVVRAARYNLPLTLAIIGGRWAQFVPFVALYKAQMAGHDHGGAQICINQHCYIAEDSQSAADDFYPAHHGVFSRIGQERGWRPGGRSEYDTALRPAGHLLVGSPQQVIDQLCAEYDAFGNTRFLLQTSIGNLPHKKVLRSMELLATKVIPAVREYAKGG